MPERLNNRFNEGLNYGAEPTAYPDEAPAKGWTDGQDAIGVLLRDRMSGLDRRTLERLDHGVDPCRPRAAGPSTTASGSASSCGRGSTRRWRIIPAWTVTPPATVPPGPACTSRSGRTGSQGP